VFLALDPSANMPRLNTFLGELGVQPNKDRVMATVNLGPVTGVVRDVTAKIVRGSKAVKRIRGLNTMFLGNTQSLTLDEDKQGVKVNSVIEAAEGFWGETEHAVDINGGGQVIFEPNKDTAPPIAIAAAVERGKIDDPRVDVRGARMLVVGNSDFISSDALMQVEPNVDFVINTLNWLLDRDDLAGIAPKVVKNFSLNLTDVQIGNIALLTMLVIPAGIGLLGLLAYVRRRR
jgi:hypothetical protein